MYGYGPPASGTGQWQAEERAAAAHCHVRGRSPRTRSVNEGREEANRGPALRAT